jgi:hypothetical protein
MPPQNPFNTPEKRFVREHWYDIASKRKITNAVSFVNYCTFPGKECLDVLRLKDLLKTTNVGYDKDSLTVIEKNIETLTDIRNKLPGAKSYSGNFEDLVRDAWNNRLTVPQVAQDQVRPPETPYAYFPYDVINLDYTGAGFKHRGNEASAEMSAIDHLFELQAFARKSFSLYLTFVSNKGADDAEGKNALNTCLVQCLKKPQNRNFLESFKKIYPKEKTPYFDSMQYHDFLMVSVPIAIINYGFRKSFIVNCRKRFVYVGTGNAMKMVSFIFDCDFSNTTEYADTHESNQSDFKARNLLNILQAHVDINQHFKKNPDIRKKFTT